MQSRAALSGGQVGKGMALWVGSAVLLGLGLGYGLPVLAPGGWADVDRRAALIVAVVYALIPVAFGVTAGGRARLWEATRLRSPRASEVALAAGLWASAYLVALVLHGTLSRITAFPDAAALLETLRSIGRDMGRLDRADAVTTGLVWLRACLLAPVGEELLFRGVLFSWIRGRRGAAFTIGVTAAAFAAIHGGAGALVPLALLVGVAAGLARERTGSVTPVMIVHVVQNVVVELAAALSGG